MQDELKIIDRVLNGDAECFRLLVERYQGCVMRIGRGIADGAVSADDLAQEVFLTAFRKLRSFDPARSRFSTWLFTIARNKAVNAAKKRRPRSVASVPDRPDLSDAPHDLQKREFFDALDRELAAMPAKQRIAFVLAQFEQLSYEEIAQIEGTRLGTVKSRINRAKARLARALEHLQE